MSRTLLVLGGGGWVGGAVVDRARAEGWRVHATTTRPREGAGWHVLDVRDDEGVRRLLDAVVPDAVVNAVLAHDPGVDGAAAVRLAREAAARGVRLVHVSTDCVLGGREAPYTESDPPSPCAWSYAESKAEAERGIAALDSDVAVVRPSLVLADDPARPGPHEHFDGSYFTDMVRQPVLVGDLAALLVELAEGGPRGTLHAAGPQEVTRHELARGLARRAGADPDGVRAASVADLGVARPAVLRLDTTRSAALRTRLRPVGDVVPL